LQQTNLPTFFAKIWNRTSASVSATAVAEAYNTSSYNTVTYTPIAPKVVKPWLVANHQPSGTPGAPFIDPTTRDVASNLVGTEFYLAADCPTGGACTHTDNPPKNVNPLEVEYVAAQVTPDAGTNICPSCTGSTPFEQSIECADVNTQYSCGPNTANWDSSILNTGLFSSSALGAECLTHASTFGSLQGQDVLTYPLYPTGPPQILAYSGPQSGSNVTTSNSIATLPIIDTSIPLTAGNPVTILGYMQVFINQVALGTTPGTSPGDIDVTILNVSGCGDNPNSNTAVVGGSGTSPVPVRLISAP
jgi:hypothetical protein